MAITSAVARECIVDAVAAPKEDGVSGVVAASLRKVLAAYSEAESPRRFGATAESLRKLGKRICRLFSDEEEDAKAYAELVGGSPTKLLLAGRLVDLIDKVFPPQDTQAQQQQLQGSQQELRLQPGELAQVRSFVASLREGSATSGRIEDLTQTKSTQLKPTQPAASASGASKGWASLLQKAGLGRDRGEGRHSEGLSFWCPLLESQRGKYSRGPEALAADCRQQIRLTKGWPAPPDAGTVQKANELRKILPVLAGELGPMPDIPLHEDVLRLYVHLLEVCGQRRREEAAHPPAGGVKRVSFGALAGITPTQPGLDAVANARFARATSRQVSDDVSEDHINQCVHVVEQYKVYRSAPKPKPLVPMSVRVVIQQSMAPADARVADAYSIVKGGGSEAETKRSEVKDIMVQVFESANTVAFERLKRGTAVDRAKRRSLGMQLSAQERQSSLQRESSALAELRVLARCLSVGESAVSALRASRSLPELAQDLIRLQPFLSLSQAMTLAKTMMKETSATKSGITVARPQKRAREYEQQQRIVIQVAGANGGGQRGRGQNGRQSGADGGSAPTRPRGGKKRCYWCQSAGHIKADCPAKKQGLPKTKRKKSE